jgi:tripartite-type tricarboxylate transporter receptor subunit TctC
LIFAQPRAFIVAAQELVVIADSTGRAAAGRYASLAESRGADHRRVRFCSGHVIVNAIVRPLSRPSMSGRHGSIMMARLVSGLALLVAILLVCAREPALALPDYFSGKTITIYVSNPPAGGYDLYARLLARHLGRNLPGNPKVIVANMPGAQGFTGANYLYQSAPRDGTALGALTQNIAQDQVLSTAGVGFDAQRFGWIGRIAPMHGIMYVWHTVPIKTVDDLKTRETIVAADGRQVEIYTRLLSAVLGARFKLVRGYPGTKDAHLALQRGEVESVFSSIDLVKTMWGDWLQDKQIKVVVQQSLQRHPDLPDVPTLLELGKTAADREVISFFTGSTTVGRSIVAPPDLPADVLAMLRAGFDATVRDEQLLADVRQSRMEILPMAGIELQGIARATVNLRPDERGRVLEIAGSNP